MRASRTRYDVVLTRILAFGPNPEWRVRSPSEEGRRNCVLVAVAGEHSNKDLVGLQITGATEAPEIVYSGGRLRTAHREMMKNAAETMESYAILRWSDYPLPDRRAILKTSATWLEWAGVQ